MSSCWSSGDSCKKRLDHPLPGAGGAPVLLQHPLLSLSSPPLTLNCQIWGAYGLCATLCPCLFPSSTKHSGSPRAGTELFLKEHIWIWVVISSKILNIKRVPVLDSRELCLPDLRHEG